MKTVSKIGIMSLAKIQAAVMGVLYLIISVVVNIVGKWSPELGNALGIPPGIVGVLGSTISGIILGFVTGAIIALLYNAIAPKIGGLQIELK